MEDIFISKIHINKVRHLENVDILISETERKHLILTGKNGSGKTSVLESLVIFLTMVQQYGVKFSIDSFRKQPNDTEYRSPIYWAGKQEELIKYLNSTESKSVNCTFNNNHNSERASLHNFLLASFDSYRRSEFPNSEGPSKSETQHFKISDDASKFFIQYLVNLRYERLDALEKNDNSKLQKIKQWFDSFQEALRELFDDNDLMLDYEHDSYSYRIKQINRDSFSFNEMPSGYSSILRIITDLIYRMKNENLSNDLQGIVLIDEIETHLHIDLQKKILPFLTSFFPKIQFIVTTHSPFVLSSVDNAVIFDLETKQRIEDLSGYSVEGIVESYFDIDQYSDEIKTKLDEYETLLNKSDLTSEEKERKLDLKIYFKDNIAKTLSPELSLRIKELETQKLVIQ